MDFLKDEEFNACYSDFLTICQKRKSTPSYTNAQIIHRKLLELGHAHNIITNVMHIHYIPLIKEDDEYPEHFDRFDFPDTKEELPFNKEGVEHALVKKAVDYINQYDEQKKRAKQEMNKIPFLAGRPRRDNPINDTDIINLKIQLNISKTEEEFLTTV